MSYISPAGNSVNFSLDNSYTPLSGNAVNFNLSAAGGEGETTTVSPPLFSFSTTFGDAEIVVQIKASPFNLTNSFTIERVKLYLIYINPSAFANDNSISCSVTTTIQPSPFENTNSAQVIGLKKLIISTPFEISYSIIDPTFLFLDIIIYSQFFTETNSLLCSGTPIFVGKQAFNLNNSISLQDIISYRLVTPFSQNNSINVLNIFRGVFIDAPAFINTISISSTPSILITWEDSITNIFEANLYTVIHTQAFNILNTFNITWVIGVIVQSTDFNISNSINISNFIFNCILSIVDFEQENALSAYPCLFLLSPAFSLTGNLDFANLFYFTIELIDIYYLFTLTGAANGKTDITIPMKSFQGRLRTGEPSYLSVVIPIPDDDTIKAITNRIDGEMVVEMAYVRDGEYIQREEIARVDLETIIQNQGGQNYTITLTGHKTETYNKKTYVINTSDITYYYFSRQGISGSYRYRFAKAMMGLNPGDKIKFNGDRQGRYYNFTPSLITYTISATSQQMEVSN